MTHYEADMMWRHANNCFWKTATAGSIGCASVRDLSLRAAETQNPVINKSSAEIMAVR